MWQGSSHKRDRRERENKKRKEPAPVRRYIFKTISR